MTPKLVYLHIPKSGGTSQQHVFFDVYGEDNVLWFEELADSFEQVEADGVAVIGGHQPISFYPAALDALYMAVVRDPIARVVSLFSHYTQPHSSADDFAASGRSRIFRNWQKRGMDPGSIIRSIENCPEFRQRIENYQCHYLSRHGPSFDGALQTMRETDCVISTVEQSRVMNDTLAGLFDWVSIPQKRLNASRANAHAAFLQDAETTEFIRQFVLEDIKLYQHIADACGGMYENISHPEHFVQHLCSSRFVSALSAREVGLRNLQMYSKGFAGVRGGGYTSTSLVIINQSSTDIALQDIPGLSVCCEVLDGEGLCLQELYTSEPLEATLPANSPVVRNLEIDIDPAYLESAVAMRVGIASEQGGKVSEQNPLHATMAQLIRVDGN